MKLFVVIIFCLLLWPIYLDAQNNNTTDSTEINENKKAIRKANRKLARQEMKQHFSIGVSATYAWVNSGVRFEEKNGIFSAQIDLEQHLGLADQKWIYSGFIIYRMTPRSGFNGLYYQLNRREDYILTDDVIFMKDTIDKGTEISGYFNTKVASFGYLFSILPDPKAFLGIYLNLYLAEIKLGINAETINVKRNVTYIAATPNFGFVASFMLRKWLVVGGGVGMFFYDTKNLSGSFYDMQVVAEFYPAKWLGLSIGYRVFDVKAKFPEENYNTYINYNLRGPSAGLRFKF